MEIVEYKGYKRNLRLAGSGLEIIATLEVGPRVMHLSVPGGPNLLTVIDSHMGTVGRIARTCSAAGTACGPPRKARPATPSTTRPWRSRNYPAARCGSRPRPMRTFGIRKEIDFSLRNRGRTRAAGAPHHQHRPEAAEVRPVGPVGHDRRRHGHLAPARPRQASRGPPAQPGPRPLAVHRPGRPAHPSSPRGRSWWPSGRTPSR